MVDPFKDAGVIKYPHHQASDLPFFRAEVAYVVPGGSAGTISLPGMPTAEAAFALLDQVKDSGDPTSDPRFKPEHITGARVLRFQPTVIVTVEER